MSFLSRDPVTDKIEIDALVQRGRWKDAESILLQTLADADADAADQVSPTTRRTVPVDDSPEVQKNKLMLAHIFRQVGRPQDAEAIDREVLETRQRSLGPEAQDTLVVMYHLATDIKLQPERLLEGLALEERVLEAAAQVYWPDDFTDSPIRNSRSIAAGPSKSAIDPSPAMDILIRMCQVADTFFMQNQAARAARLHETILRLSTTALGPGHPYTIAVMDSTGRDYVSQGRLPEAVRLLQDAVEAGRVHLGSGDSTTRRCIVHLAEAHGRMIAEGDGKVPDAKTIAILDQAVEILEESIGHDETDTISLKYYLAVAYARLDGFFGESEALQNQVLDWCRRQLGIHTVTANLMVRNLVLMYRQLGRMDKAREIENEFGRIRRSIS
jgi:tetratricopeptide (TPR) repeat protein